MGWEDRDYNREGPTRIGAGSITLWLIVIICLIMLADMIFSGSQRADTIAPVNWGGFTVYQAIYGLQLWRCLTFQFIHLNWIDLIFSMVGLYFFGPTMEQWWGARRFLAFYLLCGMLGFIPFTVLSYWPGLLGVRPGSLLFGSWGATFGVLFGCATLNPKMPVSLLFLPVTMTMRTMALLYVGITVVIMLAGSQGAGVEAAYLGGASMACVFVRWPWLLGWADGVSFKFLGRVRENARRRQDVAHERRLGEEQLDVDRILDKVRTHGLHSLSRAEKRTLQRATDKQRRAG